MTFKNRKIHGFIFLGEQRDIEDWKGLLVGVCEILYRKHATEFQRRVVPIRGTKLVYFSQEPDRFRMHEPRQIPGSSIFVETKWDADDMYERCLRVLKVLGYKERDLQLLID